MLWIILTTITGFLWATVNHIDKYLIEKYCKDTGIGALVLISSITGFPVIIVIALLGIDVFSIPVNVILLLVVAGIVYLLSIIPYLYALAQDEASFIAPLFLTTAFFSWLLGYIFLGEVIGLLELLAAVLIILGAVGLSVDAHEVSGFKIKARSLVLMLLAAFLMSLNAVLFKYGAINEGFWIIVFWEHIGFLFFFIFVFSFVPIYRNSFLDLLKKNTFPVLSLNFTNEVITLAGNILFHYATLLAPLMLVETVTEGMQPFFVLVIGVLITILWPNIAKEDISQKAMRIKISFIMLMVVGVAILTFF